jgi:hypothetical protein
MWILKSGEFLIEFKPRFSNKSIQNEIKSSFEFVSIQNEGEIRYLFENKINEVFIDQSDGGFSVSSMPYGRKNYPKKVTGNIL